jgi:hypothetical protein
LWFCAVDGDDLDHVEPENDVGIIEHAQPGQCTARNSPLLIRRNCFNGSTKFLASPRFHLYENKGVAIAANDVDFSSGAPAKIAVKNFVAVSSQKPARFVLSARAAPDMRRLVR